MTASVTSIHSFCADHPLHRTRRRSEPDRTGTEHGRARSRSHKRDHPRAGRQGAASADLKRPLGRARVSGSLLCLWARQLIRGWMQSSRPHCPDTVHGLAEAAEGRHSPQGKEWTQAARLPVQRHHRPYRSDDELALPHGTASPVSLVPAFAATRLIPAHLARGGRGTRTSRQR